MSNVRRRAKAVLSYILLPFQGVDSFCLHTQGTALGYMLLAF
jgi:hypothetical protein